MSAPSTSRLDNKVAIVTGGSRGIGAGIALELAARGASVVISYLSNASAAEGVVSSIKDLGSKGLAVQTDVSDPEQINRLFKAAVTRFKSLDIVVSNAGMEAFVSLAETTPEFYDRVFGLNTRAQFFVAQAAYQHLQPGGRVILMSSIAAGISVKDHALYAGSKAAINGFVKALAADFGHKRITVNAIAPGGVLSDMFTENAWRYIPGADKSWTRKMCEKAYADHAPLGRCAVAADIARVVCFLAGQDGEWVNGQSLLISGGTGL